MSVREWGVHVQRPVSAAEVDLLEQAGVQVITVPILWRWIERDEGRIDFAAVRHLLAPFMGRPFRIQGLLGPAMPHALPEWLMARGGVDAPDFMGRFAQYCALVAHETPELDLVRVEDELNSSHPWETLRTRRRRGRRWRDRSFIAELLLTSCASLRDARPDLSLRVTLQAGSLGWKRDMASWLAQGLRVDRIGLSLSPCGWRPEPRLAERIAQALAQARSILERHEDLGEPGELEVARVAYPTHRAAWTPRRQRQFLVQAVAAAQRGGAVGFHWSSLRDQAYDDPSLRYWTPTTQRHEGLLYYDGSPKPIMDELRVLATGDRFGEGGAA